MSSFDLLKLPATRPGSLGVIYALMCLLIPPVTLFNARAVVPIAGVAALAALVAAWRCGTLTQLRTADRAATLLIIAYIAAMLAASLGTPAFADSLVSVAKFTGVAAMALILIPLHSALTDADRKWVFLALLVSVLATAAWPLTDVVTNGAVSASVFDYHTQGDKKGVNLEYYGYFWYKSASTILVVASIVLGVYIQPRAGVIPAVAVVGICMLVAYTIGSRTATFGVLVALAAGVAYQLLGRYRVRFLIAALAFAFLLPIWIGVSGITPKDVSDDLKAEQPMSYSLVYRAHIWNYAAGKIAEKPLLGWGAGASKRIGTDSQGPLVDENFGKLGEPIPVHPHNGVLQVWLEFGFVGAAVAFLLIARVLILADRFANSPGPRIWVFSTAALFACFFGFNFSISSSWWLASVIAFIAVAAAFAGRPDARTSP